MLKRPADPAVLDRLAREENAWLCTVRPDGSPHVMDWKFLLGLELDDPGFDHSVLSTFRARLIEHGLEQKTLELVLEHLRALGLLKAGGRQRTDATHVLAAVRTLNRMEFVGETLRAALEALAVAAPAWLSGLVTAEWAERYGPRVDDYRFPKGEEVREELHH